MGSNSGANVFVFDGGLIRILFRPIYGLVIGSVNQSPITFLLAME